VVADGDGVLSIVLAGHPRLRNALMRPNMGLVEDTCKKWSQGLLEGERLWV
jgi:type II secretory pathway predicted ATPase ExeA